MAYIGVQPADAYTSFAVQHFTTSATTSYTLNHSVANENEIALFINNVRQEPGSSYAYTASGTSLTLSAATSASDTMYCVFIGKAVQTVTPTLPIANFSSTGIDDNADATAITIDSSENVLVSKTSVAYQTVGHELKAEGRAFHTADGGKTLSLNRLTSDGGILDFYKDGTEVGSIGAKAGDLGIGTGDTGLRFYDAGDQIFPISPSSSYAGVDNGIDLGAASARFKDGYFGGNIYLGGTGSANALDDYEEGTWTPTLATNGTNFSSVGYANRIGSYTKIGRLVLAPFYVQLNSLTVGSPSGNVVITGLPFTSLSNSANKASIIAYITNLNYGLAGFSASNDSINYGANVIHNTTTYQLTRSRNSNTADGIPYKALTSSSFAIVGTAIYDTN